MLSLKNVKMALLALILSLWPLILTAGIMPLAGISLNLTTMMIAAITFSTVVDDNIHIMSKYMEGMKKGLAQATLMGRIARDPEARTAGSSQVVNTSIAVNQRRGDEVARAEERVGATPAK